jgi:quercetin dioxygenase-like cupin family protein
MMKTFLKASVAALMAMGFSTNILADEVTDKVMHPAEKIIYKPLGADPNGPKGVVLFGDPTKDGPYVMRVKYPANMIVPPHTHGDKVKVVALLEGVIYLGYSETVDMAKATKLTVGSIWTEPKGVAHFGKMGPDGATLEVHGVGPASMLPIK